MGCEYTASISAWPSNYDSLSTAFQHHLVEVPPAAIYKDLQHTTTLQLLTLFYIVSFILHVLKVLYNIQTAIEKVQNKYVFKQRSCFLQLAKMTLFTTEYQ